MVNKEKREGNRSTIVILCLFKDPFVPVQGSLWVGSSVSAGFQTFWLDGQGLSQVLASLLTLDDRGRMG